MAWNYDMRTAPRKGTGKLVIAVANSTRVRWCRWNPHEKRWSGLLQGEQPLCWCEIHHPNPTVSLPQGMNL